MPFLSYLNIHMSSEDVGVASLLLTLIALCVTLYTLFRVRAVAQAQEEATAFTQELLNIDQLEVELVRVMAKLGSVDDPESAQIGRELGVTLGRVQGVRRALGSGKDKRRRTGRRGQLSFRGRPRATAVHRWPQRLELGEPADQAPCPIGVQQRDPTPAGVARRGHDPPARPDPRRLADRALLHCPAGTTRVG